MSGNIGNERNLSDELLLAVHTTESQREIISSINFDIEATLAFNESITIQFKGALDVDALERAFSAVVKRHSIFHSNFSADGKYLMVRKWPQASMQRLFVDSLSELKVVEERLARTAFDLVYGNLLQAILVQSKEFSALILSAHHLVCDGWSWSVIIQDLTRLYNAYRNNLELELPAAYQYWQYARDVRSNSARKIQSLAYWKKVYTTIPENLEFDFMRARPLDRTFHSQRIDYDFAPDFVRVLKKQAGKLGLSFYNYLYASFALYLYSRTGCADFALGISAAPQSALGHKDLAGHCVNLLPIRYQINAQQSLKDFFNQSKQVLLASLEAQFCTFGEIISELAIARDVARIPLVNVIFNVDQQAPDQGLHFEDLDCSLKTNPRVSENFEMFLNATICGDRLTLENQYNTDLFSASDIEKFLAEFEVFMHQIQETSIDSVGALKANSTTQNPTLPKSTRPSQAQAPSAKIETIQKLKAIWSQLLGHAEINSETNFFSAGGHSLLASEMMLKVKSEMGVQLALKDIFRATSLNLLAKIIDDKAATPSQVVESSQEIQLVHGESQETFTLTLQQKRAWYVQKLGGDNSVYNLPAFYHYQGQINAQKLADAYVLFVLRHPLTRSHLSDDSTRPRLMVKDLSAKQVQSDIVHFEHTSKKLSELQDEARMRAVVPITLNSKNYFASYLYQLVDGSVAVFNLFHHIIWDGWCYDIFRDELERLYLGLLARDHYELEPSLANEILGGSPQYSYADYANWQEDFGSSASYQSQLKFWLEKLTPFKDNLLDLPLDYNRPRTLSFKGDGVLLSWSEAEVQQLERVARSQATTLYNLMLCAYKVLLMHYSSTNHVVVGTPFQGRSLAGLKDVVGFFVNNLAIASELDPNISFNQNLARVQLATSEAFAHAEVSFEDIVAGLKVKRSLSHTPIYQTFFVYQDATNRKIDFAGEKFSSYALIRGSVHTDLDFWARRDPQGMKGGLDFQTDLFKRESIERICADFKNLLAQIAKSHGDTITQELDFIAPENKTWLLETLNETKQSYPLVTLNQLIEAKIDESQTQDIAVVSHDAQLSYLELEAAANRLAHQLRRQGVKPGDLVGICQSRSTRLMVSLLGILKSGAGYVPLDPDYPSDRLRYMCEHSQLKVLVCEHEEGELPIFAGLKKVYVDQAQSWWSEVSSKRLDIRIDPEQVCYVIYTSGSTGLPKGVSLSHRSVVNFITSMQERPGLTSADTLCAVTTLSFDIAVLELYLPLSVGAKLVIATREQALLADQLIDLLDRHQVNVMQATPATWRLLLATGFHAKSSFKILCGGEPFPKDLAHKLLEQGAQVWNMYGPTETTVWSTCKELSLTDEKITIGRPIANTKLYILDHELRATPIGKSGELYIGGDGLALGYLGRPDLTAERFITSPFVAGELIYQTGDLARYHSNGEVECLGRNDSQVKVRGYRIELGEIEAVLARSPHISAQVVMIREDRAGDIRIVAYYKSDKGVLSETELRSHLKQSLAPYMIPNHFVYMAEFPLTLNGKIDRKQLPAPGKIQTSERAEAESSTSSLLSATERELAIIWCDVLGLKTIEAQDDFFDLGGHSLNSVEVFGRIQQQFKVNLALSVLFEASSLSALAKVIDEHQQAANSRSQSVQQEELESLVVLRANASARSSIIFFHGVGGNILNYRPLLKFISQDYSVFGMQSPGVQGESLFKQSLSDLAILYATQIKRAHLSSPLVLAGGSMGGLLALEVARVLKEDHVKVAKVVMFDTFGPKYDVRKYGAQKVSFFKRLQTALYYRLKRLQNNMIAFWAHQNGRVTPHSVRHFNIEMNNYRLLWQHQHRPYTGDIYLIRSALESSGWYSDPLLGWQGAIDGEVYCSYVEGADHHNFVESMKAAREFERILGGL